MAIISITGNNTRVEDADATTGWASIGGGAGASAEASFPYQGVNLINRKVTGTAGFYYDPTGDSGVGQDMTAIAKATWIVKAIVTDFAGLNTTSGLRIRIGSGTGDYHQYVLSGTDAKINALTNYPTKGGLIIVPINPNISAYRDSVTGTPVLTSVDYFGIEANFDSSTAKSENVGLDAIDLGTGLTLVGGDGISTDGEYQDFIDSDEGIINNRWGFASSTFDQIKLFMGQLTIGSATATEFNDSTAKILWIDGLFNSGYSRIFIDLQNSSSIIADGSQHTGLGSITTVDSRPDYIVDGTSGSFTFTGSLINFRNVTFTSGCQIGGDIECLLLTQGSADIENATINTNSLISIACLQDPTFGSSTGLNNTIFNQKGVGHAIEIDTAGTYTFTNLFFSGYGANTTDDASLDITASTGTVTINITGGDTPTYKTAGATVVIVNAVAVKVTVKDNADNFNIQGARVYLFAGAGGDLSEGDVILNDLSDVNGIVEDSGFAFTNPQPVTGRIRRGTTSPIYKDGALSGTITSSGFTNTTLLISDE